MKILHLTLKKKWFDMIASGEKKEEYREIKPYWIKRLSREVYTDGQPVNIYGRDSFNHFDFIEFKNGYSKGAPKFLIECKGIRIDKPFVCWYGNVNYDINNGEVYVIKLGNIIK